MTVIESIPLREGADKDGFRAAARHLIADDVPPERVAFEIGSAPSLFATGSVDMAVPVVLPREVAKLIDAVVCHREPEKYALLYALIWRATHGERALLEVHSDPLVFRLARMEKEVRRDIHKMHAFVRFRRLPGEAEAYSAWFEPDNFILDAVAKDVRKG